MKLLFCKICGDLLGMKEWMKRCNCGNVCGRYLSNDSDIGVHVLHSEYARIVSISTHFLFGDANYNEFDLPGLKGTYFDQKRSLVIIFKLGSEMAKGSGIFEYESEEAIMRDIDISKDEMRQRELLEIRKHVKDGSFIKIEDGILYFGDIQ